MKDYKTQKEQQDNETLDWLYQELDQSVRLLPTQYILDRIDDHDCGLDSYHACECVAFIKELTRRMNKESEIL